MNCKKSLVPLALMLGMFNLEAPRAFAISVTAFDVPGFEGNTAALGINAQGQIVGSVFDVSTRHSHGFLFDRGVFTIIDVPGATETGAGAINDRGQIIGIYFTGQGFDLVRHNFLLDHGKFTTIDVPGIIRGINDRGQIVGSTDAGGFLLDHGSFIPLPDLGDAFGINAHDEIVGQFRVGAGGCGIFDKGALTIIDVPGSLAGSTRCFGINNRAQVVGFYFSDRAHGFLFDRGMFTTIDVPEAVRTEAVGINAPGKIVGFFVNATGEHGFIASP